MVDQEEREQKSKNVGVRVQETGCKTVEWLLCRAGLLPEALWLASESADSEGSLSRAPFDFWA